jgi:hypothetical protein
MMLKALIPAAILGALAVAAPAEAGYRGRFHHHRHGVFVSTGVYGVTPFYGVSPFYVDYQPGFYHHRRFHHHRRFYR